MRSWLPIFALKNNCIGAKAIIAAATATVSALGVAAGAQDGLAGALPACADGSTGIVLSVSPADHGARLQRGGSTGRLHDLAGLCPGDVIQLGQGEVAHVEVTDDRKSNDPLEGPISYTVPAARGMLDNAARAFASVLFPEVSDRTRTLVTRNTGAPMSPRPENMTERTPQQLAVVDGPRSLWFGWTGGAAPFHVALVDSSDTVLAETVITDAEAAVIRERRRGPDGVLGVVPFDVTFPPMELPKGDYRVRVFDANSEPPEVAELMSDGDAGVMSMAFFVRNDLKSLSDLAPAAAEGPTSDAAAIRDAICFSLKAPEDRLFEAAQHIVAGRDGAPYAMALSLLGADLDADERHALCG